jgi:hypothetical protein
MRINYYLKSEVHKNLHQKVHILMKQQHLFIIILVIKMIKIIK